MGIPKKLHFIWIQGEDAMPDVLKGNVDSWRRSHPSWSVQVWGDAQISELLNAKYPQLLHRYNHSVNYQQQKDVASLAIIDALGGVFMDADFQCLRPLDNLVTGKAVLVVQAPGGKGVFDMRSVTNAVFGATAGNPVLTDAIDRMASHKDRSTLLPKDIYVTNVGTTWKRAVLAQQSKLQGTDNQFFIQPSKQFFLCGSVAEAWKCRMQPTTDAYAFQTGEVGNWHSGTQRAYFRVIQWGYDNQKAIIVGAIAALIILLLMIFMFSSRCARKNKACARV